MGQRQQTMNTDQVTLVGCAMSAIALLGAAIRSAAGREAAARHPMFLTALTVVTSSPVPRSARPMTFWEACSTPIPETDESVTSLIDRRA
ncbi:MAG: hypothetical protein JWN62_4276 [Acidimicrobiales bacterium]|nr:hypothetical protein [Acidimicrobiales bacterium]